MLITVEVWLVFGIRFSFISRLYEILIKISFIHHVTASPNAVPVLKGEQRRYITHPGWDEGEAWVRQK